MTFQFIQLHLRNKARILIRLIAPLGLFRIGFLATTLLLLANKAFEMSPVSLPLCLGVVLVFYHANRQDKLFLNTLLPSTYYLYGIEYLSIAIPFMLIAIVKGSILSVSLCLLISCLVPLVTVGNARFSVPTLTMPGQLKGAYMYGIGFRKTIFLMLIAYACAFYFVYNQQLIQYCVAVACLGYLIASIQMLPTNPFYMQQYTGLAQYCRLNAGFILVHSALLFIPIFILSAFYSSSIQFVALLYIGTLILSVIYHQCAIVLKNTLLQTILSMIYAALLTTVFIQIWMGIVYLLLWIPLALKTYSKLRQLYDRN